jgi:hypothetical protein
MAEVSVGTAMRSGFELIRRRPLAVLTWGLLEMVALGVVGAAYAGMMANMLATAARNPPGVQPTASQVSGMIGGMFMGEGLIFLAIIATFILRGVLWAAVWRAVLHPQDGRWAYLRFGKAELFILLLLFGLMFAGNLILLPLLPILLVVGGLLAMRQWAAAIVIGVLALVALIVAVIYVELRFSLVGPMIVDDGEFRLMESWRATRGQVGGLFLIGLGVFGVLIVAEMVVFVLVAAIAALAVGVAAGGFDHLQALAQQAPGAIIAKLSPFVVLLAVLGVPLAGAMTAIGVAPWARAYRDLSPDLAKAFT